MSSIKRGVKKVFRGVKKVVKKIGKPALIIGASFLTAGLVAGGFAAFSGVSTIGGFFGAVGNTIGVGFQATMGSLGLSGGVSGSLAAATGVAPGTTLGTGALAQGLGLSAGPTAGTAAMEAGAAALGPGPFSQQALVEAGTTGGSFLGMGKPLAAASSATSGGLSWLTGEASRQTAQNTGLFGTLSGAFNGMSPAMQVMLGQGVATGLGNMAQAKELRRQERREDARGIFGYTMGGEQRATPEQFAEIGREYAMQGPDITGYQRRRGDTQIDEDESSDYSTSRANRSLLPRDSMNIPMPLLG
jgi:hypothetical protein